MAEIFGLETGMSVPQLVSGSSFGGTITIILSVIVLLISLAIGIYIWKQNKLFNIKVIHFENIAGQGYQPTIKDRARLIKVGDGGEQIIYLRRCKEFRTAYGKKMGKNIYWFAKGQDGYWYNTLLGDLDAKMGMLDIEPVDRDMRYMHVAIRKNIQERYRKVGFMEKYGMVMMGGIFLIIMMAGLWFLIDQIGVLISQAAGTVEASRSIIEPIQQALSHVDTICSGGAGYSAA